MLLATIDDALQSVFEEDAGHVFDRSMMKFGSTSLGQRFALYTRPIKNGLYELVMATADIHSPQYISHAMKIASNVSFRDTKTLMQNAINHFQDNSDLDFTTAPVQCIIPTDFKQLMFTKLEGGVHDNFSGMLHPGDEVFVRYNVNGVTFHHSGIFGGNESVYHFSTPHIHDSATMLLALQTDPSLSGKVEYVPWVEFANTMGTHASPPSIYRVAHPFRARDGQAICDKASEIMQNDVYTSFSIKSKNNQHFSSFCGYGNEFSYDSDRLFFNEKALLPRGVYEGAVWKEVEIPTEE